MSYSGWLRELPGGTWRVVCEALTLAGCWRKLLAVRGGQQVEKLVLPAGRHPERRRRPR